MNSSNHKLQAEGLIKQFNTTRAQGVDPRHMDYLLMLAQVHATLATIEDEE